MTFSKERFNSCVTEAKRCMKDGIETEYDRAIFWANERIKELTNQLTNQPTDQPAVKEATCKWNRNRTSWVLSPHNGEALLERNTTYCPTCGLRIEVVE